MDKNKKILTCLYIIIALLVIDTIAIFATFGNSASTDTNSESTSGESSGEYDVSMFTQIDADGFIDAFNSDDMQVIYFGRSTCGYCVQFLPSIQKAQEEYGFKTLYVDITTINQDGVSKISGANSFFADNYGSTPTVVLVKNGQVIASQVGYTDYNTFASMLENNGFSK